MMLAADTCMLLISYCKQMMIDFRVLDRAQVLEIMIQGFLDYRDNYYVKKSSRYSNPPNFGTTIPRMRIEIRIIEELLLWMECYINPSIENSQ